MAWLSRSFSNPYLIKRSRAVWWLLVLAFAIQLVFVVAAIRMPWSGGTWMRFAISVAYLGLLFTRSARTYCFIGRSSATESTAALGQA